MDNLKERTIWSPMGSPKPISTISLKPQTSQPQLKVQETLAQILKTPMTIPSTSKNPLVKTSNKFTPLKYQNILIGLKYFTRVSKPP